MNIITLFCNIDDFMRNGRQRIVCHLSEVMTSLSSKWVSDVQTLLPKTCSRLLGCRVSKSVSYSRFVQLIDAFDNVHYPVSPSWIPHVCGFAIISGFHRIASSQSTQDAQRLQWGGSTVLNSTSSSMRAGIS